MYTVSSCIWYFPLVTLSIMLLLGDREVGECREATFTKECEWLVTERTRMRDSEMRGSLLEWMQGLNLPHVFTFDLRKMSRLVTLQSNTVVPHRFTAHECHQMVSYCRCFSQVQLVYISSFNLFSCDHYVHRSLNTSTVVYCWHLGINCPQTWNITNSVFLVVLTFPPVILYVVQWERNQIR